MSKGIFITATGTDLGKTYVTALIIKKLREAGYKAGYYKAALSGVEKVEGQRPTGDAHYVKTVAKLNDDPADMVSYMYESAVSPHLAANIEGNPVTMEKIENDYKMCCANYDYVTVEGSGGIICPLRYDEREHIFLEDVIKKLKLSVIIVAGPGLGTINATVLTVKYLESQRIPIKGIIINRYHGGTMEDDNIKMIEALTHIPVIARVREGDASINIEPRILKTLYTKDGK